MRLSEREVLVNTRYPPVRMVVDPWDEMVSRQIIETGTWEAVNIRTFQRLVKEGDTILNIGSHVGLEAILLAKQAGETGKLFIFEPYYVTRRILTKNIYLNNLEAKTTIYGIAATNKKSTAKMFIGFGNTGGSSVMTDPAA